MTTETSVYLLGLDSKQVTRVPDADAGGIYAHSPTTMRATLRYMDTVTHREMRNNSGEILRRVEGGESVQVTNNGRVAALIVPPASDPLTDLTQRGQLRPALREPSTLRDVHRRAAKRTSEQIRADSRGQW